MNGQNLNLTFVEKRTTLESEDKINLNIEFFFFLEKQKSYNKQSSVQVVSTLFEH